MLRRIPFLGRAALEQTARGIYRALPINPDGKRRLKDWVFRNLGFLVRRSAVYQVWTQGQPRVAAGKADPVEAPADHGGPRGVFAGAGSGVFLVHQTIKPNLKRPSGHSLSRGLETLTPAVALREIIRSKANLGAAKRYYGKRARTLLKTFLSGKGNLMLSGSPEPKVSIILVLYNRAELTYLCLTSLQQTIDLPVETIIVDNASTDETAELLDRIEGASLIRNDDNLGFLKGVNQALGKATGDHVLLLNNDAQMFPGALAAALRTLESQDGVGAVGGRIVLLDGSLQEAGSIIWSDGSCLGYGRGETPDDPGFLYRRDVDYCSAAFLLVRRDLFLELGGFDETFAPAYYEETDLCMRLRERGYRVVYEPDAVILHYEFASSASQEHALRQQETNQSKFAAKHAKALTRHCSPSRKNLLVARSAARRQPRLLLLDDHVPHRWLGAGFPRANDIVRGLVDLGVFVTIYPTEPREEDLAGLYSDLPREVEFVPGKGVEGLKAFFEDRANLYDVVLVSRPNNMEAFGPFYEANRALLGDARIIYDAEAIFALREIAKQNLGGTKMSEEEASDRVDAEIALGRWADKIVTVSQAEAAEFINRGFPEVHVLGHRATSRPTPAEFDRRRGILFVGTLQGDDAPNADSVVWFVETVWPILAKQLPADATFVVAGTNRSQAVWSLDGDRVHVRGFVAELDELYNGCRLFVVPSRYAAGLPYKAHEAAARGLPMVTTSLIADQLGWTHGEDLLVADAPDDMAQRCLELYQSRVLWQRLRDGALRRIETDCSQAVFRTKLTEILEETASVGKVSAGR